MCCVRPNTSFRRSRSSMRGFRISARSSIRLPTMVLPPALPWADGPMDVDLRWVGGIMYRNAEIEETGLAAGVLGHPALGVAWLANKIGPHGHALEPGHIVLAGSFTRVVFAQKGDTLHADFGSL